MEDDEGVEREVVLCHEATCSGGDICCGGFCFSGESRGVPERLAIGGVGAAVNGRSLEGGRGGAFAAAIFCWCCWRNCSRSSYEGARLAMCSDLEIQFLNVVCETMAGLASNLLKANHNQNTNTNISLASYMRGTSARAHYRHVCLTQI